MHFSVNTTFGVHGGEVSEVNKTTPNDAKNAHSS